MRAELVRLIATGATAGSFLVGAGGAAQAEPVAPAALDSIDLSPGYAPGLAAGARQDCDPHLGGGPFPNEDVWVFNLFGIPQTSGRFVTVTGTWHGPNEGTVTRTMPADGVIVNDQGTSTAWIRLPAGWTLTDASAVIMGETSLMQVRACAAGTRLATPPSTLPAPAVPAQVEPSAGASSPAVPSPAAPAAEASPTSTPLPVEPSAETPSAETPSAETPSAETPSANAPLPVDPTAEVPSPAAPSPAAPSPAVPATSVPLPVDPAAEVPSPAVPSAEAPSTSVPSPATPSAAAPATSVPQPVDPSAEAPSTSVPSPAAPSAEAPSTNVPLPVDPAAEAPSPAAPSAEAPSATTSPSAEPDESKLPLTGMSAGSLIPMGILGLGAVALGATLIVVRRRRDAEV
ncbi:hypothetical protein [Micromonospora sp. WMMD812]|uniref:hypothetical protein n=1 Tax=Micromonospora sp. WMMD812 TaxID=3015152 RepID=UPI00248C4A69|nr:hypothetical protein [Micromonospora sp. WMMD812]WBB66222.1 hypothetical protein O7603_24085 [Micromonospora sp. WMMD812]